MDTSTLVSDELVATDVETSVVVVSVIVIEAGDPAFIDDVTTTLVDGCSELDKSVVLLSTFETKLAFVDVGVSGADVVLCVSVPVEFGAVTLCVVKSSLDAERT